MTAAVVINHSPVTAHVIMRLVAEGRFEAGDLVVVNARNADLPIEVNRKLFVDLADFSATLDVILWASEEIKDIKDRQVLVPQTQELFYAVLAGLGSSYSYIEEGVGTHRHLEMWLKKSGVITTHYRIKSWIKATVRRLTTLPLIFARSSSADRSLVWRSIRRPIHAFMNFSGAKSVYTFISSSHPKVVSLDFGLSEQLEDALPLCEPVMPCDALVLLPPRTLSPTEVLGFRAICRQRTFSSILVKCHPALPIDANALSLGDGVEVKTLDGVDCMLEPVVVCARRRIGTLIHFGSSAGIYVGLARQSTELELAEIDLAAI